LKIPIVPVAAPLALAILAGCAALDPDGGSAAVEALARPALKQPLPSPRDDEARHATAQAVRERLTRELGSPDAVAIALANHPRVQVILAEVGASQAELAQAGRLRNPGFSWAKYRQGDEREIERRITLDVVGLLTMPLRVELERGNLAAAQGRAALEVVRVAEEARRAWTEAVAAAEMAAYAEQVKDAAWASAELAKKMAEAGHFNRLARSRETLFHAEAEARLARARLAGAAARERLARALAVEPGAIRLPTRLPDPPAAPRDIPASEQAAIDSRLDVQGARREAEATARALGLSRVTGFVNVLHLGYEWTTSNEAPRKTGYEIELELPIFDWGAARNARAEALYRQAAGRVADVAQRARSEVRESHAAYRTAWELARRYRDEIVPLRKAISEENLLRYNGMLIGVFELLADAREQSNAVIGSIEATRDFWIADADLETALLAGPPQGVAGRARPAPTAAAPAGAAH
jgi:outer membrane protein TolC